MQVLMMPKRLLDEQGLNQVNVEASFMMNQD